jgi:hypothetical protein
MESQSTSATWPGAFGIFKRAKEAAMVNLGTLLALDFATLILGYLQGTDQHQHLRFPWPIVMAAILLNILVTISLTIVYLASVRGKKIELSESLRQGTRLYVNGFIATVLVVVLLSFSLLLFIVPFFFVLPRLVQTLYYLVDRDLEPMEAIKASWNGTKGHSLKVWGLIGAFVLFSLLMLVLVGFYLLFVFQTAFALLYLYVNGEHDKSGSQHPATKK